MEERATVEKYNSPYIYMYLYNIKFQYWFKLIWSFFFFTCELQLFFIFTLYNTSNHRDRLKVRKDSSISPTFSSNFDGSYWLVFLEFLQLGVTSSEEAARWVRALQDAALNPGKDMESCTDERKWQPFTYACQNVDQLLWKCV